MKSSVGRMSLRGTLPCARAPPVPRRECVSAGQPLYSAQGVTSYLPGGEVVEPEGGPQLVLGCSATHVDLIPEDEEGHVREVVRGEEGLGVIWQGASEAQGLREVHSAGTATYLQLLPCLGKALSVHGVDQEDYGVNLWEVVLPHTARCAERHVGQSLRVHRPCESGAHRSRAPRDRTS